MSDKRNYEGIGLGSYGTGKRSRKKTLDRPVGESGSTVGQTKVAAPGAVGRGLLGLLIGLATIAVGLATFLTAADQLSITARVLLEEDSPIAKALTFLFAIPRLLAGPCAIWCGWQLVKGKPSERFKGLAWFALFVCIWILAAAHDGVTAYE